MIAEHSSQQRNWSEQLWTLFVLELWARTALDNTLAARHAAARRGITKCLTHSCAMSL